jgi:type IV secretion system protein VirB4
MSVERLARAFLDHCFRSIEKNLDGRPTFIYLEEASFLLNNVNFLSAIDDWLKTFRKKNAFVWLTIQSPQSISGIADEKVRATITDNIPNLILGYNKKLENHRKLYGSMFAMSDEQIDLIGALRPQRDYLQISDGNCRVMRTSFDHHLLAYIRSESQYQDLFTKAQASGALNWRDAYLADVKARG